MQCILKVGGIFNTEVKSHHLIYQSGAKLLLIFIEKGVIKECIFLIKLGKKKLVSLF